MPPTAPYDEIADWYDEVFLGSSRSETGIPDHDRLGIDAALCDLLGSGAGTCLDLGCGTGVHAARVRSLGRTPIGVDVSSGMLRHARGRLAIAQADARQLPLGDGSVPAVISMMVHTDMPEYPRVLGEVARVLARDGVFVHVGVHPCFCGGFADRSDPEAVVIRRGYLDGHWTKASWTDQGVRDKVGATHWPLPKLLQAILDAGLSPDRFIEGGEPIPAVLAIRARKRPS